ncbi:MAG: hypothetical protein ACI9FD_004234 [Gammaproteobacteria bacterium]|jgi:hypothetical protein
MMNHKPLVQPDFELPVELETPRFVLRMLTIHDVIRDYDAVMSSADHLKSTYSNVNNRSWPDGLTLENNLIDLGWHQREFTIRRSFAYKVVSPDESAYLGCIYINPTLKLDYDAMVMLWVRASELDSGLDDEVFIAVKTWVTECWSFERVAYPGRDISVSDWQSLSEAN